MKKSKLSEKVYFTNEDERSRCVSIESAEGITHIDDLPPVIPEDFSGGKFYLEHADFHDVPERYFNFETTLFEDGSSSVVLIEDGEYLLPVCIREIVRENKWTCVAFRHIDDSEPQKEVVIIGIYFSEIATFEIDDFFVPCGAYGEIFVSNGSYCCYYNQNPIMLFGSECFDCSTISNGRGTVSIDYTDVRGISFFRQYLSHNAANMKG